MKFNKKNLVFLLFFMLGVNSFSMHIMEGFLPPLEHPWKKKSFEKYLEKQQKAKGKGECIE